MFGKSRSRRRAAVLSATSALAIIAGLGGNASACSNLIGPADFPGFENLGSLDCLSVTNNARVHGNVSNGSTGVIGSPASVQPATVLINNATISGAVQNSGTINAGGGTPGGILVTGGSVVTNGIVNNGGGTIAVGGTGGSAFGIKVSQSSFAGGITNSGVITVSSTGSAVGIQIGGGSPPPPPASINPSSTGTPTIITTSVAGNPSPLNKHKHH
jgi:hypothetical protein